MRIQTGRGRLKIMQVFDTALYIQILLTWRSQKSFELSYSATHLNSVVTIKNNSLKHVVSHSNFSLIEWYVSWWALSPQFLYRKGCEDVNEWWDRRVLEGSGGGIFKCEIPSFALNNEGKSQNTLSGYAVARVAGTATKINFTKLRSYVKLTFVYRQKLSVNYMLEKCS